MEQEAPPCCPYCGSPTHAMAILGQPLGDLPLCRERWEKARDQHTEETHP
jgi:hypothetical protein